MSTVGPSAAVKSVDERIAVFQFLKKHQLATLTRVQVTEDLQVGSTSWQKCLALAGRLIEFFGRKTVDHLNAQLKDNELRRSLRTMDVVLCKIQNKLSRGKGVYTQTDFPQLEGFDSSISAADFFEKLKRLSHWILPYPQRVITYPAYDADLLKNIEWVRQEAFTALNQILMGKPPRFKNPNDEREKTEYELNLTRLYWAGGALGDQTYSDIVDEWAQLSPLNARARDRLLRILTTSHWIGRTPPAVDDKPSSSPKTSPTPTPISPHPSGKILPSQEEKKEEDRPPAAFPLEEPVTINKFLVEKTVQSVQSHLQAWIQKNIRPEMHQNCPLEFSPTLVGYLKELMFHEDSRSDIGFFSMHMDPLLTTDWLNSQQRAKPFFHAVKVFFDLIRRYEITGEKYAELLELLIRCPDLIKYSFSTNFLRTGKEDPQFTKAWQNFKNLMSHTPLHPSYLKNSNSWTLLALLLERADGGDTYSSLFDSLAANKEIHLTVHIICSFCIKNQTIHYLDGKDFVRCYESALTMIHQGRHEYPHAERLFLDPPIDLKNEKQREMLKNAGLRAQQFMQFVKQYKFPFNPPPAEEDEKGFDRTKKKDQEAESAEVRELFRTYLYHPHPELFELLADVPALKIAETPMACLNEVLVDRADSYPSANGFGQLRINAQRKALFIRDKYSITGPQTFSLYVEFVRLLVTNRELSIFIMAKFIEKLEEFCPGLNGDIAYYLYRYHPWTDEGDGATKLIKLLDPLIAIKQKYQEDQKNKKDLVIDPDFYNLIETEITSFVASLKVESAYHETSQKFEAKMKHEALLRAFFPPEQFLTDFFRITGLNSVTGIRWAEPFLATHLGQLRSVFGESTLKAYLHWQMVGDSPVLLISFSDGVSTQSAFVRMHYHFAEMLTLEGKESYRDAQDAVSGDRTNTPSAKRRAFFMYMLFVSSSIFKEKLNEPALLKDPTLPKEQNRHRWIHYYPGLSENVDDLNLSEGLKDAVWKFLIEVKLAYRKLYLAQTKGKKLDIVECSPLNAASRGNIYVSSEYPRGILVPRFLQNLEPKEFYTPDFEQAKVERLKQVLSVRTRNKKPLELDATQLYIGVTLDKEYKEEYPLVYLVQTATDLNPEEATGENYSNQALPKSQVEGTFVTLGISFQSMMGPQEISLPMHYRSKVLGDSVQFGMQFDKHILMLKALFYYHLEVNRQTMAYSSTPLRVTVNHESVSPAPSPGPFSPNPFIYGPPDSLRALGISLSSETPAPGSSLLQVPTDPTLYQGKGR